MPQADRRLPLLPLLCSLNTSRQGVAALESLLGVGEPCFGFPPSSHICASRQRSEQEMFAAVTRCLLWLLLPGVKLPCDSPNTLFLGVCLPLAASWPPACPPLAWARVLQALLLPRYVCGGRIRSLMLAGSLVLLHPSLVCVDQCLGSLVLGHSIFWGAARHFGGARQCWPARGCQALNKRASQLLAAAPALF